MTDPDDGGAARIADAGGDRIWGDGLGQLQDRAPLLGEPRIDTGSRRASFRFGTTGLPTAIVHGDGGIPLEHLKALGLHADAKAGDRFFWSPITGPGQADLMGADPDAVVSWGSPANPEALDQLVRLSQGRSPDEGDRR